MERTGDDLPDFVLLGLLGQKAPPTLCCSDCLVKALHFSVSVAPKQVDWNFLLFLSDY
jgi:hypothetical protein